MFFFFRPARKDLLDAKEPASDPVNLAVAAVVRVVALSKHGLTATIHVREFRRSPDNADMMAPRSLIWLYDQRPRVQQRKQLIGMRYHVRIRCRNACGLQNSRGDERRVGKECRSRRAA